MAEKLAPNVIDPAWILDEGSGKLGYGIVRVVSSRPAQTLRVVTAKGYGTEMADRYLRIMADKRRRQNG